MAVDDLYILPETVHLIPVSELSKQARAKFECEDNDFVITYSNARNTSKVIDFASASLLKEFRSPKSFVEGVYRYSILNKLDPAETLEESYMLLSEIRNEGFIVIYDKDAPKEANGLLKSGDVFKGYEIVSKVQGISDTQVYKVKKEKACFALKIVKTTRQHSLQSENFYNEIELLGHMDGEVNPKLIESGENEDQHYMLLEWCEGTSSDRAVENFRNLDNNENLEKILSVSCAILKAYEHLHAQKIIHSDIHPRNILVSESGKVKIIDFGLATREPIFKQSIRGGIGFYFEPEYAQSVINKQPPHVATFAGEQYSLAALIYFLLTGKHYLNFSFEKDVLFRQIATESPIPFLQNDIVLDGQIEQAIFKALSKKPEDRYTSVAEFANTLSKLQNKKTINSSGLDLRYSFSAFCDTLKRKFGQDGMLIRRGLQVAPTCSINYGAAGIAYMFYRMACLESDPGLLAVADIWANRGANYFIDNDKAFYSTDIDITKATVGTTSISHTSSGVHLVQALISNAMGDYNTYFTSVQNFIKESSKPCENLDLAVGKSSTLIACSILLENCFIKNSPLENEITRFGNGIMEEIWNQIDSSPEIRENNSIRYRGIAHGLAGILYATLKWCNVSAKILPTCFFDRVEQLVDLGIERNGQIRWNITSADSISWPGWCHGSAGYIFLWTLLFKYSNDRKFLDIGEKAAQHFLETDRDNTNGSLCCGMAGQAYALLNLFKITENNFFLHEATRIAKKILVHAYLPVLRNNSLYKGDVGIGVLFTELTQPRFALMPLFE
jgi:eukaryotic-like serine/threonine-protein kinase